MAIVELHHPREQWTGAAADLGVGIALGIVAFPVPRREAAAAGLAAAVPARRVPAVRAGLPASGVVVDGPAVVAPVVDGAGKHREWR